MPHEIPPVASFRGGRVEFSREASGFFKSGYRSAFTENTIFARVVFDEDDTPGFECVVAFRRNYLAQEFDSGHAVATAFFAAGVAWERRETAIEVV